MGCKLRPNGTVVGMVASLVLATVQGYVNWRRERERKEERDRGESKRRERESIGWGWRWKLQGTLNRKQGTGRRKREANSHSYIPFSTPPFLTNTTHQLQCHLRGRCLSWKHQTSTRYIAPLIHVAVEGHQGGWHRGPQSSHMGPLQCSECCSTEQTSIIGTRSVQSMVAINNWVVYSLSLYMREYVSTIQNILKCVNRL